MNSVINKAVSRKGTKRTGAGLRSGVQDYSAQSKTSKESYDANEWVQVEDEDDCIREMSSRGHGEWPAGYPTWANRIVLSLGVPLKSSIWFAGSGELNIITTSICQNRGRPHGRDGHVEKNPENYPGTNVIRC